MIVFGVLVAATFAAFFVAQRLKSSPSVVQSLSFETRGTGNVFSPNGDGRRDRVRAGLTLEDADHVTLTWMDSNGDPVRTVVDDRPVAAHKRLWGVPWDGTDDDGKPVPDGRYKLRITLRDQGRTIVPTTSVLKDTKAPQPKVLSIGPRREYGPELMPEPGGALARVHFGPALDHARIHVFRTAPGTPREVLVADLRPGQKEWDWDGTTAAGRRVSPGTYLVVPEWRDLAGNVGTGVPLDRAGLPILKPATRLPGRGGITVRYIGAQPPVTPAKARERVEVQVDARQERYSWQLRRLGESEVRAQSTKPKTKTKVVFQAPGGNSGLYVFEAHTGTHSTRIVLPVQARRPVAGTVAKPRGVLVVLPYTTWQGLNPADDDGDGAPNTLALGGPARFFRVMAGNGLPQGFTEQEGPLLGWLDRSGRRYDITTDLALVLGKGPRLTGHQGVLIPGDARWLPARVRTDLRTFARRGGTVVSTGTDSLRRSVRVDAAKARFEAPTAERATDLFGARLRPVVTHKTDLEVFQEDPKVDLFADGPGLFAGVPAWEQTDRVGADADLLTNAVTQDPPGKWVVVASSFGKGLVIRPGFPSFAQRLASDTDPATNALMARMWTLLSR
ncbi:MAG TPA: FlgD immunoglobulin-like domain containing protein [Baekduia sp.]|nr:FlgD immunoglobulin-like domain containing protein [Baekduia sp.]